MKILGLFLCLIFSLSVFGQTKKPIQNLSSIVTSVKIGKLKKQKENLQNNLKELSVRYSAEYSEVKSVKSKIADIDKQINSLQSQPQKNDIDLLLETDLSSDDLMKIIIIQNQQITRLLENQKH